MEHILLLTRQVNVNTNIIFDFKKMKMTQSKSDKHIPRSSSGQA